MLSIQQFTYHLPEGFIANEPMHPRDHAKLMVINRQSSHISHHHVYDLPTLLPSNSVLVFNDTKVFPARIYAQKPSGGKLELLFIRQIKDGIWESMSKPGLKPGQTVPITQKLTVKVLEKSEDGTLTLETSLNGTDFFNELNSIGHMPLPPYINPTSEEKDLREKYQTTFAKEVGSAAAPTAGLHFTPPLSIGP